MIKISETKESNTFLQQIQETILQHNLLLRDQTIVVGVSGGADSVALLYALHSLGYSCIVAHCNFHLRGSESMRDHEFARLNAKALGLPFFEVNFDTEEYAQENGLSIEMACRELRYEWFDELREETGSQAIAVAHHQDDTIETFFLNLLRGTGIVGLTGIKHRNGYVVRPFLDVNRAEVEQYLADNNIEFIVDSSNLADVYQRNKIRLNLIPMLESIAPQAKGSILRTIENLKQTNVVYQEAIQAKKQELLCTENDEACIDIEALLEDEAPRTLLYEVLKPYGVNRRMAKDVLNACRAISGKQFYTETHHIVKDRKHLIISPIQADGELDSFVIQNDDKLLKSPINLEIEELDYFPGFIIPKERNIASFDAEKITFPLILRKWRLGDRFTPFGMRNSQKISDFFSNNKFSLLDKQRTWILECNGRVMWIVNHRTDNRFRITDQTQKVLMIRFTEK